jgi:hypothetical protein
VEDPNKLPTTRFPASACDKVSAEAFTACWPVSGLTCTWLTFPENFFSSGMCIQADATKAGIARRTVAGAAQIRFASADAPLLLPV